MNLFLKRSHDHRNRLKIAHLKMLTKAQLLGWPNRDFGLSPDNPLTRFSMLLMSLEMAFLESSDAVARGGDLLPEVGGGGGVEEEEDDTLDFDLMGWNAEELVEDDTGEVEPVRGGLDRG